MSQTTIVSTITAAVTLGSTGYENVLTIESTGAVMVSTTALGTPLRAIYAAASGSYVSLTNFGTILSSTPSATSGGIGIEMLRPADIKNDGLVSGTAYGILLVDGGSILNIGTVMSNGTAIDAASSTYIINKGLISGASAGVVENESQVLNEGSITSNQIGVYVGGGATLDNSGEIAAPIAVYLAPGGYLLNSGTLTDERTWAIYSAGAATIALLPTAEIDGWVGDATSKGELILEGTTPGTIDISQFIGFSTIVFQSGATWQLEGPLRNFDAGQTIIGFGAGDSIVLDNFTATTKSYVAGTGAILSNGTSSITLDIQGNFTSDEIIIADTPDGTTITAPCFLKGTHITTKTGEVPIEFLKIGDLVKCLGGGYRSIKWLGTRLYDGRLIADNRKALPICIRRDALADNLPTKDLFVSPDHSLFLHGKLVAAELLVNGISIFQLERVSSVSYFHIELDQHDIIFAENCAAESFLDADCRARFQNVDEYYALYSRQSQDAVTSSIPRMTEYTELNLIKLALVERAKIVFQTGQWGTLRGFVDESGPDLIRGWAQDSLAPDTALTLHILSGDICITTIVANEYRRDLKEAKLGSGYHGFIFKIPIKFRGSDLSVVQRRDDGQIQRLPYAAHLVNMSPVMKVS